MTKENAIKAYENYVATGQNKLAEIQANHILKKYKIVVGEEEEIKKKKGK